MTSESTLLSPSDSSSILDLLDEVDLCLLLLLLQFLEGNLIVLRANLEAALDKNIRKDELAAQRAKPNIPVQQRSFNAIAGVLSPIHFRRMSRMNRPSFDRLCKRIISKVGDEAAF